VALRERLAFSRTDLIEDHKALLHIDAVQEGVILSTCNRVEIYSLVTDIQQAALPIRQFLAKRGDVDLAELEPILYEHADVDALTHLFRVASSLDAMVVGEAQIVGQVKEAYTAASDAHTVGALMNRSMNRAFATAKRVRNETSIARHPVSVSSVAADLAARIFGDMTACAVLVIGAGEMAELAVQHLMTDGARRVRVVNRTDERAVELAFKLGAKAGRFEDLTGQLLLADIVITSTGSPEPILSRELLSGIMRQRKQRPLFIVDIAVPQDVERAVTALANVYAFNIDDLEQVVANNVRERRQEGNKAERIIKQEVARFEQWMQQQEAVPVIKELRQHFRAIARAEADRTAHALHIENGEQRETLNRMAEAIVNKLLHDPSIELKRQATSADGTFLARATRRLFQLSSRIGKEGE
jgi:glutamyl-tRNA reductase